MERKDNVWTITWFERPPFNNETHCWSCELEKKNLIPVKQEVNNFDGRRTVSEIVNFCKPCARREKKFIKEGKEDADNN